MTYFLSILGTFFFPLSQGDFEHRHSLCSRLWRFSSPCLQVPFQWLITSGTAVSGVSFLIQVWKKAYQTLPSGFQAQNQPLTYALQREEASKMISQLLNGLNYFCPFFFFSYSNKFFGTYPTNIDSTPREGSRKSVTVRVWSITQQTAFTSQEKLKYIPK